MSATPPPFVGKYEPYLDTAELADFLNAAADGKSSWSTDKVRIMLAGKPGSTVPSPFPDPKRRKKDTATARLVTTRELLREHFPLVYNHLRLHLAQPGFPLVTAILPEEFLEEHDDA